MGKDKNEEKRGRGRPATGKTPQRQFRCPNNEWELFQQAAETEGVTVPVWLRKAGVRAAKRAIAKAEGV